VDARRQSCRWSGQGVRANRSEQRKTLGATIPDRACTHGQLNKSYVHIPTARSGFLDAIQCYLRGAFRQSAQAAFLCKGNLLVAATSSRRTSPRSRCSENTGSLRLPVPAPPRRLAIISKTSRVAKAASNRAAAGRSSASSNGSPSKSRGRFLRWGRICFTKDRQLLRKDLLLSKSIQQLSSLS